MSGSGPDLDSWTAGYQTRDLQRDAPYRLGAVVFALVLVVGIVFVHRGEAGRIVFADFYLKWIAAAVLATVAGLVAGRLASLRLAIVETLRADAAQAERRARNRVALEAFLDNGTR